MHTYQVNVTRDDRWWMITVPELMGYEYADGGVNFSDMTQARRISEISSQARDFICTVTDKAPSEVDMVITGITVPGVGDVAADALYVKGLRESAAELEGRAADEMIRYARRLTAAGIPVRDTAELLDVSPQRVSQLANA